MEKAMGYRKPGTRLEKKAAHPLAVINKEEATTLDIGGSFILVCKIAIIMIATSTSQRQGRCTFVKVVWISTAPSGRTDYWGY
jgi:hypothetical protein